MRIPPPNPLTTVCVWIAAIFIAIREAAATEPKFSGLVTAMSGSWSYLPLGVLVLAALVYLVRLWLPEKQSTKEPETAPVVTKRESTGFLMEDGGVLDGFMESGHDIGVHMKRGGVVKNGIVLGGMVIGNPPKKEDT